MRAPETRYARRDDGVSIGYQIVGDGPALARRAPGVLRTLGRLAQRGG